MAEKQDRKWRGVVSEVIAAPIDKVWRILADFDGHHRNYPLFYEACETTEGEINKVGSLRSLVSPLPDGSKIEAKERLLTLDDKNHTLTYSIEMITLGWTGYEARITAKSDESGQTLVDWTFEVNPVSGQTEKGHISPQEEFYLAMLQVVKAMCTAGERGRRLAGRTTSHHIRTRTCLYNTKLPCNPSMSPKFDTIKTLPPMVEQQSCNLENMTDIGRMDSCGSC